MSHDVTPAAYKTRLGNLTAKSVLALIADTANDDGYGWPSVQRIAEKTEVHPRTVMRVLQVFADIGLIAKVDRGKGKNCGIQLAMEKLGTDLRAEFAAAYAAAQSKKAESDQDTVARARKCRRDIVAERSATVSATLFSVSATSAGVAETVPPHPHKGGTVSEPPGNASPLPPSADAPGGEVQAGRPGPLTLDQLAHVGELRSVGRRADAAMWEGFYCEQNLKEAQAAEQEHAKAKRLEELKGLLPDEPSAVSWVVSECGFALDERRRGVRGAIAAVMAQEHARGRPLWDMAPAMAEAWREYERIYDLLAVAYGPVKFFRLGIWSRPNSWRIDERRAERARANVGSARETR